MLIKKMDRLGSLPNLSVFIATQPTAPKPPILGVMKGYFPKIGVQGTE
jgi:hypothetical protein